MGIHLRRTYLPRFADDLRTRHGWALLQDRVCKYTYACTCTRIAICSLTLLSSPSARSRQTPNVSLEAGNVVCGAQTRATDGSKVRVSKIAGGCGATIPYAEGHSQLVEQNGNIWCGMAYKQMEGHYLICLQCYTTDD